MTTTEFYKTVIFRGVFSTEEMMQYYHSVPAYLVWTSRATLLRSTIAIASRLYVHESC